MKKTSVTRWAVLWHSKNKLDGIREHIIFEERLPRLFNTWQQARNYAVKKFGYIRFRKDLRSEPHGWRMPRPIKCTITYQVNEGSKSK